MPTPVFRFAPSPNGDLHLGHALSALINAEAARRLGGRMLVRIEDIDTERCTPELQVRQIDDLMRLGIPFETPIRRQSEHFDAYRAVIEDLAGRGLVYRCFATRLEIRRAVEAHAARGLDPDGTPLYPRLWRDRSRLDVQAALSAGKPFAWRLDMDRALAEVAGEPLAFVETGGGKAVEIAADPARWGDVVLARKETPTSYHLAVVMDDALQGVTHVVRGRDLLPATDCHVLLQRLLALPTPRYHHHRLVLGADGRKLSKSKGSESLRALFALGVTPAEIVRLTGFGPDDLAGLA